MLLLYPHAFQSLIFNNMASKRIKEFGLALIPGDLVYRNKDELDVELELDEGITELSKEGEECEGKTTDDNETSTATNANSADAQSSESIFKRKVKPLTEEDIASGSYTIYDVVLPLPGHDITYPDNVVGSWYKEILEKYELSSEKLKHSVKLFAMAGAYRRLVVKPKDMSWEFRSYAKPQETLILSDLELLKGKKLEDFKEEGGENVYEALILDFCLPTAVYATMMIRELLKSDTSAAAQTLLQQAALKDADKTTEVESKDVEEKVEAGNLPCEKRKAVESDNASDQPTKIAKSNEESVE